MRTNSPTGVETPGPPGADPWPIPTLSANLHLGAPRGKDKAVDCRLYICVSTGFRLKNRATLACTTTQHTTQKHDRTWPDQTHQTHGARSASMTMHMHLVHLVCEMLPPTRDARLGRPIATDGNGMTRPGALTSEHSLGKRQGRMPVGRIGISAGP